MKQKLKVAMTVVVDIEWLNLYAYNGTVEIRNHGKY